MVHMSTMESLLHGQEVTVRSQRAAANGIELHYIEAGPTGGSTVILLHGFPEFCDGWRHQLPALVAAGFHVIALDQRGYNLSSKPSAIASYDLDVLAQDVLALADHLGLNGLQLVGHDWGASVAWWLATTQADRLAKMVVLNAPHPALWRRAMRTNRAQRRKSWYVHAFRLPWLPELGLRANNFKALAQGLVDSSLPGTFSATDLEGYRRAWAQPGAVSAMVNWYRALLRKPLAIEVPPIAVDTLMIWGCNDKFGDVSVAEESIGLCAHGRAVYIDDATHWVHHERPEHVNRLLIDFLRS
jgi:epoxide hydrolase 4